MAFWKGRAIGPSRVGAVDLGLGRVNLELGLDHRTLTGKGGDIGKE